MARWKYPVLLLLGIGVSNIGAWVYLIALNLIVLNETGSPLAVAFLYILSPIAALCSNFWAGSIVDRFNTRRFMGGLDFFRAVCIVLIPLLPSLLVVYLLVFIINMASAVFHPASMVYMTKLIPKEDRQRFNALRNFINSCGALLGPGVAGVLFWIGTPYTAIYINAVALIVSGLMILLLPNVDLTTEKADRARLSWRIIKNDWRYVILFSKKAPFVAKVYLLFCTVTVFMTAIDSLEAAFAKGILQFSDVAYGLLVSIFGVGIIAGSIINAAGANKLAINQMIVCGTSATAIGYLILYLSTGFYIAGMGVFLIGFSVTFVNTGFLTFYQNHVPVEMMGRFGSIFGMIEAAAIIGLTVLFGLAAELIAIRPVALSGIFGFLLLTFYTVKVLIERPKNVLKDQYKTRLR